jgi:hypothetical protein
MPKEWEDQKKERTDADEAVKPSSSGKGPSDPGRRSMQGPPDTPAAPTEASEARIIGNPERDAHWRREQEQNDTCAIAVQRGILQKHTGKDPGEDALREQAEQEQWYLPGQGTPLLHLGSLLDANHVPNERSYGDTDKLRSELELGHDVIAVVDANYLNQIDKRGPGHAVWVTGLEYDQSGKLSGVFLNDPDPRSSAGRRVPAEVFTAAWAQGGNHMVATRDTA